MEIQSPCIQRTSVSRPDTGSCQRSSTNSVSRYTPIINKEEKGASLLEMFQDSLEITRPKSRLIDFTEAESKAGPSFEFPRSSKAGHQRKSSLTIARPSSISEMLLKLREKPKQKSSLKHSKAIKKQKTVSFCSHIEMNSPDNLLESVVFLGTKNLLEDSLEGENSAQVYQTVDTLDIESPTTDLTKTLIPENIKPQNSNISSTTTNEVSYFKIERISDTTQSTQQNLDLNDSCHAGVIENRKKFIFEEDIRNSLPVREIEINEYSTVAYCNKCEKETVTEVGFEKIKGENCADITEWIICWMMPACMYRKKMLVHRCALCKDEIFKAEY
ncbi:hypothetical protein SteCoe_32588 [Stentor coeruleus]|uniref:LITAF domain-containing protein n=1 Tax=Stentor coeruleus TaxID=5963 RepID=A0A1R2AYL7_9CILI|nr:hypothetical protein SteCoe_32588 [Stentor coeruleus]